MKRLIYRTSICMLSLVTALILSVTPASAQAAPSGRIDIGKQVSLTIDYRVGDEAVSGVDFSLYRVADVSARCEFTATERFAGAEVNLVQKTTSGWQSLIPQLESYVALNNLEADQRGVTLADGTVQFSGMPQGLYMVVGELYTVNGRNYLPTPFLISLPNTDGNGQWLYDVTARPKPPTETSAEETACAVEKNWKRSDGTTMPSDERPSSVTMILLEDGVSVYDTITLTSENWRYTWDSLPAGHTWTVVEGNVPAGFTSSESLQVVERADGTLVYSWLITNTQTGDEPTPTPTPTPTPSTTPTPTPSTTPTPTPSTTPTPTPSTTPTSDTPDTPDTPETPDTPITPSNVTPEQPEDGPDNEVPDRDVPEETLPDDDVPTDNRELPDEEDGIEEEEILDGDIPLAYLPNTTIDDDPIPLGEFILEDEPPATGNQELFDEEPPVEDTEEEEIGDDDVPLAELPQTGMLWWPVPVQACSGMALFVTGWYLNRKDEADEE